MIEINIPLGPLAYIKVSGHTSHEVLAQLTEVERGEIPSVVGRVVAATGAQESIGRNLGGELVEEHDTQRLREDPRNQPEPVASAPAAPSGPTLREPSEYEQKVPGAPVVLGQATYFATWMEGDKSHGAYVHPFLYDPEKPMTDNAEDPRLASGEAWFFSQAY